MKNHRTLLSGSIIISFLTIFVSATVTASPFQNGSFENGTNGWKIILNSGGDRIGSIEGATAGNNSYNFNAFQVNGKGILAQTFDTTIGQTYLVSFDFGSYGLVTGYTQQVQIDVRNGTSATNGTEIVNLNTASAVVGANSGFSFSQIGSLVYATDTTGASPDDSAHFGAVPTNPEFSTISFSFTASSGSSTLVFSDLTGNAGQFTDTVLDNISIAPVPEPSTVCLSVIGVIGFFSKRKLDKKFLK